MIDTDKYEGLTIDDWYKMNHHDWKYVVNEHNDLLAEVKQVRQLLAEVLPRKDGVPHLGATLWGLESELKRVVSEIAIILDMAEREEE